MNESTTSSSDSDAPSTTETDQSTETGPDNEHERGHDRRVGPVFDDRDLAVRLATCEHPDVPAKAREAEA